MLVAIIHPFITNGVLVQGGGVRARVRVGNHRKSKGRGRLPDPPTGKPDRGKNGGPLLTPSSRVNQGQGQRGGGPPEFWDGNK